MFVPKSNSADTELNMRVSAVVRGLTRGNALSETARWIAKRRIRTSAGINKLIEDFCATCTAIDEAKQRATGLHGNTIPSNHLMQLVCFAAISNFGFVTQADADVTNTAAEKMRTVTSTQWFYPKMITLAGTLDNAATVCKMAYEFSHGGGLLRLSRFVDGITTPHLIRDSADSLFQGITELRRYGIKPSYFRSLLGDGGFVYFDPFDYEWGERNNWLKSDVLSFTALSRHPEDASIPGITTIATVGHNLQTELTSIDDAHAVWLVRRDGEADLSLGYDLLTVRSLFAAQGAESAYDSLRFRNGVHLFDLTVAREVVHRFKNNGIIQRLKNLLPSELNPDFALPRIQALYDLSALRDGIEQELEEDMAETLRRATREHTVECHIRRLPPGSKPSAAAVALAAQRGIKLRDGETFVRKHNRGTGNPMPTVRNVRKKQRHKHRR